MQAPSRGISLDQLRAPLNEIIEAKSGEPATTLTGPQSANNPLALLNDMLRVLAPSESQDTIAFHLASLAKQAANLDLCVVMLVDQGLNDGPNAQAGSVEDNKEADTGSKRLWLQASSPDLNGRMLAVPPLEIKATLWEKLRQEPAPGQLPVLDVHEQGALNPLANVVYGSLFIIPLAAGPECLGLLYGYTSSVRDLATHEALLLQAIAGYAAISIANRRLLDSAHSNAPLHALFDDLLSNTSPQEDALRRQAAALNYDVTQTTVIVLVEIAGTPGESEQQDPHDTRDSQDSRALKNDRLAISSRVLSYVRARLQERSPRSLLDEREHRLYCIVALEHAGDAADLDCWLISLMQQIEVDFDMQLFAGISSVCSDIRDYRRGSAEAQEALQIGLRLLRNSSNASSARFSELSAYRYLYPFAREHQLSDAYLDHIETLARYDREHKRGNLLHSLETYLALGGNIKEAAERLKVHRNTLTQRLERIQSLCAINLDASNERFSLQLALMIYRLR